jgi:hypothetical protein
MAAWRAAFSTTYNDLHFAGNYGVTAGMITG